MTSGKGIISLSQEFFGKETREIIVRVNEVIKPEGGVVPVSLSMKELFESW